MKTKNARTSFSASPLRGSINSLMGELLEGHIRNHTPQNSKSADEAAEVIEIATT